MKETPKLTDGRIVLEPFAGDHVNGLVEAVRESLVELMPWLPWAHAGYGMRDATEWARECAHGATGGSSFQFAVLGLDGRLLGGLGLRTSDALNRVASIGYWVRTSATRQGVATAAVRLAGRFAFERIGITRIEIYARPENVASRRVAERAGAEFECIARNRIVMHGTAYPAALYSLVPDRTSPTPG